ncbi:MAG TPA: DUF11 domain-containing protein, partial [Xanthomonadaceae bacterium]|nr:DUF11 domain-containing protein [Xanthomonadaceae bacterium]
ETDPVDDTVVTPVEGSPALAVSKALTSADPDPIVLGSELTYTITATNTGNITLTNVVVSDALLTPNSITCPSVDVANTCVLVGTYEVTQADVENGEIVNTATADSDQAGPVSDQLATPIDQPLGPGLGVNKTLTDAPDPIDVGSVLTYTVTALNSGDVTLTNVVVSDPLLTPDSTTCASVPPDGTCVLVGTYTVTEADVAAAEIENTGTADSDQFGPISDTLITPVGADVWVEKVLTTPGPFVAGQSVTFVISVGNAGPLTATNVVVEDVPTNLTITGVAPAGGVSCPGGAFPCTIASLANGVTVNIGVTATIDAPGPFSNSAGVDAAQPDPDPDNNADASDETAGVPGGPVIPPPVSIPGSGPVGLALLALLALLLGFREVRRVTLRP